MCVCNMYVKKNCINCESFNCLKYVYKCIYDNKNERVGLLFLIVVGEREGEREGEGEGEGESIMEVVLVLVVETDEGDFLTICLPIREM